MSVTKTKRMEREILGYDDILSNKDSWMEVKRKAEQLENSQEYSSMVIIERTTHLLNILLDIGLKNLESQQVSFFIDELLWTIVNSLLDHKEFQTIENYTIAENILFKTLELILFTNF